MTLKTCARVYKLVVSTDSASGKRAVGRDSWYLVYDSQSKDTADPKFDWPSGHRLIINRSQPVGTALTICEWTVNLQDESDDSSDDARKRSICFVVWIVAIFITVIAAVLAGLSQLKAVKRSGTFLFAPFLEEVISSLDQATVRKGPDGKPVVDIEIVRLILRMQYLEGHKSETVRDALNLPRPGGVGAVGAAKTLFRDRLEYFAGEISNVLKKLGSRRGR